MERTVGLGIVGFGRVAEQHCDQTEASGLELVAACDGSPERREVAASYGAKAYADYDALLARSDVELVIVCTPPNTHCELTLKALDAGKHVMVEKPFAMDVEEAHQMTEAAARRGRILTAHQNRRFDGDFVAVQKILETGLLGTVYSIESRKMDYMKGWPTWGTPAFLPEWRVMRKYGGGLVYDWGSHLGDQILQVAPASVESVYAECQSRVWSKEVDDHFKALVRFSDGTAAVIEVSANAHFGLPRWLVCGEKGTLISENGGFVLKTTDAEYEFGRQPTDRGCIHQNLHDAICSGADLLIKPEEILRNVRLLDSIFDSAKIGEVIRW